MYTRSGNNSLSQPPLSGNQKKKNTPKDNKKGTPAGTKSGPGKAKAEEELVEIELKCVGPGYNNDGCSIYTPILIPRRVHQLRNFLDKDFMCGHCSTDLIKSNQEEIAALKGELSQVKSRLTVEVKYQNDQLRQTSLKNTLRISGLAESENENVGAIVSSLLTEADISVKPEDFTNVRRVGVARDGRRNRPIIMDASNETAMRSLLTVKKNLKGSQHYGKVMIREELTPIRWKLLRYISKLSSVKYVDSRNGHLLCYLEEGDPVMIHELEDIRKLGVDALNFEEISKELNF